MNDESMRCAFCLEKLTLLPWTYKKQAAYEHTPLFKTNFNPYKTSLDGAYCINRWNTIPHCYAPAIGKDWPLSDKICLYTI